MTTTGLVVFGLVSLLALMSLLPPLAAKLRLPYSVLLAAIGFILGAVVSLRPDLAVPSPMLHDIIDALASVEISSEAFILIFLPTLLFEVALAIDVHLVFRIAERTALVSCHNRRSNAASCWPL